MPVDLLSSRLAVSLSVAVQVAFEVCGDLPLRVARGPRVEIFQSGSFDVVGDEQGLEARLGYVLAVGGGEGLLHAFEFVQVELGSKAGDGGGPEVADGLLGASFAWMRYQVGVLQRSVGDHELSDGCLHTCYDIVGDEVEVDEIGEDGDEKDVGDDDALVAWDVAECG